MAAQCKADSVGVVGHVADERPANGLETRQNNRVRWAAPGRTVGRVGFSPWTGAAAVPDVLRAAGNRLLAARAMPPLTRFPSRRTMRLSGGLHAPNGRLGSPPG